MKRLVVILALAILLGAGAYLVSYGIARSTFCQMPDAGDSSGWMRQEFHLTDTQYAQVKKLEADYHPHCVDLCDQIEQSHLTLKNLILANGTLTPEIEAALKKDGAVQQQCREDMLRHFYEVSQAMPAEEGKRYLEIMQAQVVEPGKTANATAVPH
jgi:Spy/CpxP family protein refolding chaperone